MRILILFLTFFIVSSVFAESKGIVSGGDYAQGTVLDLEKMKKNGEEFFKVPASDEEIKKIVEELTAS